MIILDSEGNVFNGVRSKEGLQLLASTLLLLTKSAARTSATFSSCTATGSMRVGRPKFAQLPTGMAWYVSPWRTFAGGENRVPKIVQNNFKHQHDACLQERKARFRILEQAQKYYFGDLQHRQ